MRGLIIEGEQDRGSLITARLAIEFGREVSVMTGNPTQEVRLAPIQSIQQAAKLITGTENGMEALSGPIRAALVQVEPEEGEQRNLLEHTGLTDSDEKLYGCRA